MSEKIIDDQAQGFKKCASCKKLIGFGSTYWRCNVSTCNQRKTDFGFCSVECWDSHVPRMNHRESWAIESTAPRTAVTAAPAKIQEQSQAATSSAPSSPSAAASAKKVTVIRRSGQR